MNSKQLKILAKATTQVVDLQDDPGFIEGVIVVTGYEKGYYEGSGNSLALTKYGSVYEYSHSHCSCYGPLEGTPEYLGLYTDWKTNIFGKSESQLEAKFIELCDTLLKIKK